MSYSYNPEPSAVAQRHTIRFLSQRDLSLRIPVNFVPQPAVALTPACFGHGRYERFAAAKCFANLLATGFRKLEADIYWDASRSHWSLCPVELGSSNEPSPTTSSQPTATSSTAALASNSVLVRSEPAPVRVVERQTTDSTSRAGTTAILSTATFNAASETSTTPPAQASSANVVTIGPYMCTPGTDLALLSQIISEHLTETETNLNATTVYLTVNVHAASLASDPTAPAQQPADDELPSNGNLISDVLSSNASEYLYTPADLFSQRSSLNQSRSWFAVDPTLQPNAAFFQVDIDGDHTSSPDGWPSESFIEIQQAKRLLVQFGQQDPQMANYDYDGDDSTIFPREYLTQPRFVTSTTDGNVSSGCFFNPDVTSVAQVNNSWALTSVGPVYAPFVDSMNTTLAQVRNLTHCGISPLLNRTLENQTADQSYQPYTAFVASTIWSWAEDQPANASSSDELEHYRCAALNSESGFWEASDCGQSHYGACRIGNGPYSWEITYSDAPYDRVDLACNENSKFDVPRTSLENAYLQSVWRAYQHNNDDDSGPLLWLDFNDLDVSQCWVIGQNTSCPYSKTMSENTREVVVPVVASVIVFTIAVLTVLSKCAGNRQTTKRRKRRDDDGHEYEGIPG